MIFFYATRPLNIGTDAGANYVANALRARGVTSASTAEEAAAIYESFLKEQIASHGGKVEKHANQITTAAETLKEYYEPQATENLLAPDPSDAYRGTVKRHIKRLEDHPIKDAQDRDYAEATRQEQLATQQQQTAEQPASTPQLTDERLRAQKREHAAAAAEKRVTKNAAS